MAESGRIEVGTAHVVCPECDAVVPAVVTARLVPDVSRDRMLLACTPDMTDVWAHMWAHDAADVPE